MCWRELLEEKQRVHLKIGRILLYDYLKHLDESLIIDVLNQINNALPLLEPSEKQTITSLNLTIGKKYKKATAYQTAIGYLEAGLSLLEKTAWHDNYDLCHHFYEELAECYFLAGDHDKAEQLFSIALENTESILDKANLYYIKMLVYTSQNNYTEVINTGTLALNMLNVDIRVSTPKILRHLFAIRWKTSFKDIAQLDLPVNINKKQLIISKLLATLYTPLYLVNQKEQLGLCVMKNILLALQYGRTVYTAESCLYFALILTSGLHKFRLGYAYAKLGLRLADRIQEQVKNCRAYSLFSIFISHWNQHLEKSIPYFEKAYQIGLEIGDLNYAGYSQFGLGLALIGLGQSLQDALDRVSTNLMYFKRNKGELFYECLLVQQFLITTLQQEFKETTLQECEELLQPIIDNKDWHFLGISSGLLSMLLYFQGDYKNAFKMAEKSESLSEHYKGPFIEMECQIFYGLCLTKVFNSIPQENRKKYWKKLKEKQKLLKLVSQFSPNNYLHQYYLLSAEMARIKNQDKKAVSFYNLAISGATNQRFIKYLAIANECLADFYERKNNSYFGKIHLERAYQAYKDWGALSKVKLIEQQNPFIIERTVSELGTSHSSTSSSVFSSLDTTNLSSLNLVSVLKLSETISSEIHLDKLLKKLLCILLESAGAQRGVIISKYKDQWFVESEGNLEEQRVLLNRGDSISSRSDIPLTMIRYVERTNEHFLLQNPADLMDDPYIRREKPQSTLMLPVLYQGQLRSIRLF